MTSLNVINAGIPGETSQEGLRRLANHLEDDFPIKLMILCFGGNDMIQGVSMTVLKNNLKTMIQMAKSKGIDVLIISIPNLTLFGLSPLSVYDEVANEENVPLISGLLSKILSDPSLKSDQIHPNALGYRQIAEAVYENLKAISEITITNISYRNEKIDSLISKFELAFQLGTLSLNSISS